MKISIVMATYNGEKYIIEQLESIRLQTRVPDEVLIFDDGSSDNTLSMISDYIEKYTLTHWTLIRNGKNLGWRRNFIQGFSKASGDLIFSADQDDIWSYEKIDKMATAMIENPTIEILACNIDPFCEKKGQDKSLPPHNINCYGNKRIERVSFDRLWLEPRRQGCTMCFRREILSSINCIWFDRCAHDLALWSYGVAKGSLYIINEKLVRFRRHDGVSSPSNRKTLQIRSGLARLYHDIAVRFLDNKEVIGLNSETVLLIEEMDNFYCRRYKAMTEHSIIDFIFLLFSLGKYPKPSSWVADIIASLR